MTTIMRAATVLLLATSACSGGSTLPVQPGSGDLGKTGVEGIARRGPIQPVCREGEPCDTPLHAKFTLQQAGRVIVRFRSDSAGRFLVYASPGGYAIVPDEPIGIGLQTVPVVVGAEGLTHVDLMFDTGIR